MTDSKPSIAELALKQRKILLLEKFQKGKLSRFEIRELAELEAEPLPPNVVKTCESVAKAMGVSLRTVHRWKKEGIPITKDGYFDIEMIKLWYIERNEKDKDKNLKGIEYWEEQKVRYGAEKIFFQVKKIKGDLISRREVERGRVKRVMAIKRAFLGLPMRIAPVLAMREPREIQAILYEAIGEIIDGFAKEEDEAKEKNPPSGLDAGRSLGMETPKEVKG